MTSTRIGERAAVSRDTLEGRDDVKIAQQRNVPIALPRVRSRRMLFTPHVMSGVGRSRPSITTRPYRWFSQREWMGGPEVGVLRLSGRVRAAPPRRWRAESAEISAQASTHEPAELVGVSQKS